MDRLLNIVTPLHVKTKRDYMARMKDDKINCSLKARDYGQDYWDGNRRFGYGGYKFIEGRWAPVAKALIKEYKLVAGSRVLDVGCGKGFLLYEMLKLQPGLLIDGFDTSNYGLKNAHPAVAEKLYKQRAQCRYFYPNKTFDLVISLNTLHNLRLQELEIAMKEIERVGKNKYIVVEAYRNVAEMHNLECWALTAESILHVSEWEWLYKTFGYTGDREFIFFE